MQTQVALELEKKGKEVKKKRKSSVVTVKLHDDDCFRCGQGGELVMCDNSRCSRAYHLRCLKLSKLPLGVCLCYSSYRDFRVNRTN